jgi:hypothetical protein
MSGVVRAPAHEGRFRSGMGTLDFMRARLIRLLAGCWLIDRYVDMPIRRRLNPIIPRMRALRAES